MTPAEIVSLLSITTPDLSSRIGTMTKVWSTPDLKITGRFHYIKFRDSKPTVEDLVLVAHARMVNFFIPRKRIDEAIAEMTTKPTAIDPWVFLPLKRVICLLRPGTKLAVAESLAKYFCTCSWNGCYRRPYP